MAGEATQTTPGRGALALKRPSSSPFAGEKLSAAAKWFIYSRANQMVIDGVLVAMALYRVVLAPVRRHAAGTLWPSTCAPAAERRAAVPRHQSADRGPQARLAFRGVTGRRGHRSSGGHRVRHLLWMAGARRRGVCRHAGPLRCPGHSSVPGVRRSGWRASRPARSLRSRQRTGRPRPRRRSAGVCCWPAREKRASTCCTS